MIPFYLKYLYLWKDILFPNNNYQPPILSISKALPNQTLPVTFPRDEEELVSSVVKVTGGKWNRRSLAHLIAVSESAAVHEQFEASVKETFDAYRKVRPQDNIFKKRDALNYLLVFLGIIAIGLFSTFIVIKIYPLTTTYQDCWEVMQKGESNGVYEIKLNHNEERMYTLCKNAFTMIQKTDPDSGNRKFYFHQTAQRYKHGFGVTTREYWIGLEQLWRLNKIGNDVLRVEGTFHNGSNFWVEYDNFTIESTKFDNISYQMFGDTVESRAMMEYYPITSMKQYKSSSGSNHQFVMVRPNYLRSVEEKCIDRYLGISARAKIHDRLYAGFYAQAGIYILLNCIKQY